MNTKLSLLFLLPLMGGCSYNEIGISYRVFIDPAFDRGMKEEIVSAVSAWQDKLPDLNIMSINVGDCSGDRRDICIHASSEAVVRMMYSDHGSHYLASTSRHHMSDSADTYLATDDMSMYDSGTQVWAIAHELGHAMGLDHIDGNGVNVMYWEANNQYHALPSCDDAAQFYAIRGLSTKTEACPQGGSFTYFH